MELNLISLASMPRPHPYLESLVCVCVCVWMLQQLTTLCMWVLRSSVCFPVCVCVCVCACSSAISTYHIQGWLLAAPQNMHIGSEHSGSGTVKKSGTISNDDVS